MSKKDKFFEVLRNIFVGVTIEGDSGYVNLMRIKSKYYKEFKDKLLVDIDSKLAEVGVNFEEELYNKLYTFFKKYFSDSGSIYFTYTPLQEKVYEHIYRDDRDVMLFWKTHMLYYVKSEQLFNSLDVKDEETGIFYYFDVSTLTHKKNNEKKELVFDLVKVESSDEKKIYFNVKYSASGSKTKIEDIHKSVKKQPNFNSISIKEIEKQFSVFKRQNEVDYFINKNAKEFLCEQFSLWLKGYLLDDSTIFEDPRLKQLKALQAVAFNIIKLVSQFEDELVKIWNKPKFSHSSNYVVTLDKIAEKDITLLKKILKNVGMVMQLKEWQELGIVSAGFDTKNIFKSNKLNPEYKYLPLDTKFVKDLELDILSLFDDLDNELDGWLIHSENYQALNTIKNKFHNKVDLIYIDPPFNTGDDFDYEDNYQDSTWLTIMNDRLALGSSFLTTNGTLYLHLDENANFYSRFILDNKLLLKNEIIWNKGFRGTESKRIFQHAHDTVFYYVKGEKYTWNDMSEEYKDNNLGRYNQTDSDGKKYALIKRNRSDGSFYYGKTYPKDSGKSANDVISWIPTMASTNKQRRGFQTQKPEELLQVFIENSSNQRNLVLDFFCGSGTTISTAHKSNRKWIGIDMGEHYFKQILPRMKEVLAGKSNYEPCGISEDVNWKGGGFFKYFSMEQYEETLNSVKYEDKHALPSQDVYNQYIFLKDLKLADDVVKLDDDSQSIKVDLTKLHANIDFAETLSHLTGKFIKKIKKEAVFFTDGTHIELASIDYKIIKPLIWW